MADPEETPDPDPRPKPWLKPVLASLALLLVAGAVGFGIGYLTRSTDSGPVLDKEDSLTRTKQEVGREMARLGFIEGKRSGRSHGIIAGGMAAESEVTIDFREQRASAAQTQAAEAQSELAGMAGSAPPIPDFSSSED